MDNLVSSAFGPNPNKVPFCSEKASAILGNSMHRNCLICGGSAVINYIILEESSAKLQALI